MAVFKILAAMLPVLLFSPAVGEAKTLRYSDHEPLGGMRTRFLKNVLFVAIERESKGRLKIEEHWEGKLASGYDALRVVGTGRVADMAIVVPEYDDRDLPLHQIFKSFPTGPTASRQVSFFRQVYAEIPQFPAELAKQHIVNLFFATGYPVAFFGTKLLKDVRAIKGEKWRTASFWHADFLKHAGATPVSMPWGQGIFQALQSGKLNGVMVNVDSGDQLNIQRVAPNVLISKNLWLGHVYLLVMNKDTWNGLAKKDQQAIGRAAKTAYAMLGSVMNSSFDAQVADLRKDGANVRILDATELKQWSVATRYQEAQATWVKEQEHRGSRDAAPVMKKIGAILNEFTE